MRSKLPLKTIAWELAAVAALAGCVEGILQVTAPFYGEQLFDHEYTANLPMAVNADNYRGVAVPKLKSPGTYRILALGDSITFGTGVASEHTWPQRLGARMHERTGRVVDVINAGIEGASLADVTHSLDTDWGAYDPDLITVALTGNMVSLEVIQRDGKEFSPAERYASFRAGHGSLARAKIAANRLVHAFCLPSFLSLNSQNALYWLGLLTHNVDPGNPYGAVLAHGYAQGGLDPGLARTAWERFDAHLIALNEKVKSSGKALVVTYVAPRFTLTTEARDNEKNVPLERLTIDPLAHLNELAAVRGLTIVDVRAALRARRALVEASPGAAAPLFIPFDYAHLDQTGHDALAEGFAARVSSLVAAP